MSTFVIRRNGQILGYTTRFSEAWDILEDLEREACQFMDERSLWLGENPEPEKTATMYHDDSHLGEAWDRWNTFYERTFEEACSKLTDPWPDRWNLRTPVYTIEEVHELTYSLQEV